VEADEVVGDGVDEEEAVGELAEERGDPRSGLFSAFSALSAR